MEEEAVPYKYRICGINRSANQSIARNVGREENDDHKNRSFLCDDKFNAIIDCLEERGWTRCYEYDRIPSSCQIIFRNLAHIKFPAVFDRYVNHMRNSQHLSNKALLAYHLKGANMNSIQPLTWSSAFQDLSTLIGMVLLNEIHCALVNVKEDKAATEASLDRFHAIHQALLMDPDWQEKNAESLTIRQV